jgi:hypothetical protein
MHGAGDGVDKAAGIGVFVERPNPHDSTMFDLDIVEPPVRARMDEGSSAGGRHLCSSLYAVRLMMQAGFTGLSGSPVEHGKLPVCYGKG